MPAADQAAVRAQLGKILASPVFVKSPRMCRFLRFVVERSIEGACDSIKEYTVGVEVFGKAPDYDPQTDSTVRTEASKLRTRLGRYYDAEGRDDGILISIPKGSYVPVFESRTVELQAPQAVPVVAGPATSPRPSWVAVGAGILTVAVLAVAGLGFRGTAPAPLDAPTPLTAYPGVEGPPSLSPDGNFVAFEWTGPENSGSTDIWIKAVGSEARRRLTETAASERNPAWSPDGSDIAFVRTGEGVFVISQLGGPEKKVSNSGTHVNWAADSKSILIRDHEAEGRPFGIYQIALDTLKKRRLTQASHGIGDWRFEVSPDGRMLAFIRYERPGVGDLYVTPMQGGEPRRLTDRSASIGGVTWTADGRELVYSVGSASNSSLWRIPAGVARPGKGTQIITNLGADMPSLSRPAPGRPVRLAFQTTTQDIGLRLIDLSAPLEDGVIHAVRPVADSTHAERPGPFSPDGESFAFVSDRTGSPQLWICRRDGNGLRQITSLDAAELVSPTWSPDAQRIAFSAALHGNSDIYIADLAGGVPKRLTTEPSMDLQPFWSRDGRCIYFTSDRAGAMLDIWRIPAEGGVAVRVTEAGGFEPAESGDGQSLFYLDGPPNEAGGSRSLRKLTRRSIRDGMEALVLQAVHPFWWSVSGKGIYLLTRESSFDAIDLYRLDSGATERIGKLPFRASFRLNRLTVSSDGRWALVNELERWDADLMVIDHFR